VGDLLVQAIVLVEDLGTARAAMLALGFAVADGGRHPGRGTANLIVPFGHQYLELLAVVDEGEARASPQGRPVVAALSEGGPGLARWSVEASDIEATGRRLGYGVERRQRVRPDGVAVTWRSVAVDEAWAQPWRCAYMAWDDPSTHPARRTLAHPNGATGFADLTVNVPDRGAALAWMGGAAPEDVLLLTAAVGGPSLLAVTTPSGRIVLGAGPI